MNDKIIFFLDILCYYKDYIFKIECLVLIFGIKFIYLKI